MLTSGALLGRKILLVISGGIAAYKALELIRLLKKSDAQVRCILTKGGAQFVTPLSVAALSGEKVHDDLWSLTDEAEMGHIKLSRSADLVVVAPASADIIAKMAHGRADDLATTVLLASDKPILVAPAMNPVMWDNPATQDNLLLLGQRGMLIAMPDAGAMACGETGPGRMAEPADILKTITDLFLANKPLAGKRAIVTSGPTYEAIDPVRFIGNRSSGKQGHSIAQALADAGAAVTLVTGPVALPHPRGLKTVPVESAQQMLDAVMAHMPCDIAVCAAAVSDWRPEIQLAQKMKKRESHIVPDLKLVETVDILKTLGQSPQRPGILVGFAAETEHLIEHAVAKLQAKSCDLLLVNDVSGGRIFGADETHLHLVSPEGVTDWGAMDKTDAARKLARVIEGLILS